MAPIAQRDSSDATAFAQLAMESSVRPVVGADATTTRSITNAMTVDVEDYFHVSAFADRIAPDEWQNYHSRVEQNVDKILALFSKAGVRGTFFTLGWVAERYPQVVRRIVDDGHEIASHGMNHVRVGHQSQEAFRADARASKALLEDLAGVRVHGYRAASFSIGRDTLWAHDILAQEGYRYSSSIYPIRHDLYGMPDAPRHAYRADTKGDLIEVPISTVRLAGRNLPAGGGGYFRLMPYGLARQALKRINGRDGQPCVFYFHPWELDPDQPRIPGISLKTSTRHYLNLRKMEGRLRRLLAEFSWDRMDTVYFGAEGAA